MSNTTNIEQVKNYLSQNPPEIVKTRIHDFDNIKGVKGFFQYMLGLGKIDFQYEDTTGRITETLPYEGDILLSDSETTIMILDETQQEFVKAKYDMNQGQVIPISSEAVALNGFKPASQLSIEYFGGNHRHCRGKDATASFLETIIKLSDVPLLELGKHKGDSCNRYLPVRKYQKR